MHKFFISCDWGTSAFRLRLVQLADQQILAELISGEGMAAVNSRWKMQDGPGGQTREKFTLQVLLDQLGELQKKSSQALTGLPVLISGMASSSIGIRELPYAPLPFSLDGGDALIQKIEPSKKIENEWLLISGVCTAADVMRGEETQLIGLGHPAHTDSRKLAISIFPGTHSKHVQVRDGRITDFKTFMTGELFDLISRNSILKEAVSPTGPSMSSADLIAFDEGVHRAAASNILHALFSVRVNQLFKLNSREQNHHYLSGLLIGTELKDLLETDPEHIRLCSGRNLFPLYQRGLETLGLAAKTSSVSPETMDRAAAAGQIKIFEHYYGRQK